MKPTTLDFAILGILQQEPQTGYGVRKIFETTAIGNYSSSPGTIYPALKRLQKLQFVIKAKSEQGKDIFKLTTKGETLLKQWLISPITMKDIKKGMDVLILRFAFMSNLLAKEQIVSYLADLETQLHTYLKELNDYHEITQNQMPLSGRLAFEYGILSFKTALQWCKSTQVLYTKNL